jgi:hypothetical protein
MEDIIDVYQDAYNPLVPVVCMDESNKQLVGEVMPPIPMSPGHPLRVDHEYVRNGVAEIFMAIEPLGGRRRVKITETRTRTDWAQFIKELLDQVYPQAEKIPLVMDNLYTHSFGSLYETFPPEEARRRAMHLEIHYTPKHGTWLNIAEIEICVLSSQCLARRIPSLENMASQVSAWQLVRNSRHSTIHWLFPVQKARAKLAHLYPKILAI